jgi:TatD DNase family protein
MNVVPDSRLFLETDDSPVDIEDVLRDAAKVRGVEVETLQAIVRKNIQDIFFRA